MISAISAECLKLSCGHNGCDCKLMCRMPKFSSHCAECLKSGFDCYADGMKACLLFRHCEQDMRLNVIVCKVKLSQFPSS